MCIRDSHNVDRFVQQAEQDDRGQNRKRDGDGNDESAAPAADEEQNHHGGQAAGNQRFTNYSADCAAYKDRLIGKGGDL